jgi:single-stranded-DNA-specific exonuclease
MRRAGTFDLGFAVGPRLNAAGRLADMGLGIECLITDDTARALNIAQELDVLNRERRGLEASMQRDADTLLASLDAGQAAAVCLFDEAWHQGVVGLLASRVKDRVHRPVFAFASAGSGELRGSGRSVPGLHLRDALDLVSKRAPGLLIRFGGHAAAAGLTMRADRLDEFRALIEASVREMVDPGTLSQTVETDGSLEVAYASLDVARMLGEEVWGQGFPPPLFLDDFVVENQRIVGEKHLKLRLSRAGQRFNAMLFRHDAPLPARMRGAYRLTVDEFNGAQSLQLTLEHCEGLEE